MIGAQFCVRTFPVTGGRTHQPYAGRQIRSSLNYSSCCFSCSSFRFSFQLDHGKSRRSQILVSCNSSRSSGDKSNGTEQPDHEYAEAFVLLSGEFAVEKLIDSTSEDESWDCCPNQFQLVRNLAETLGYKVTMVKITERVVNTYFARILFCKPGEIDILSVDARPSDAINVAVRCRVPIYVRKQIVLTDGIRIGNGMGRKSIYDASLDSAADGPDIVAEELDLVMNMNLAVKEERYSDAATWKDKLIKLRESRRDL
ncbi:bifunctional nuclease 2 isoform X3 [Rhododendron vialii]|uniref:bifunctional nuclease 2 isoform X3 n=1 Tax=Rhododendron vialii TaxID=182163 RepID=UPI0026604FA6|nr:bifunctional nuclease 2 isoform X3 [Rhododendron vialii]